MPNLLILFNHTLTKTQISDARTSLGVNEIIEPSEKVRRYWRTIPPKIASLQGHLEPVRKWLADNATTGDLVLIQGEFGAIWIMVNFAFECGLIPIYSTTRREAVEKHDEDGSVQISHTFDHVRYRRYENIT